MLLELGAVKICPYVEECFIKAVPRNAFLNWTGLQVIAMLQITAFSQLAIYTLYLQLKFSFEFNWSGKKKLSREKDNGLWIRQVGRQTIRLPDKE